MSIIKTFLLVIILLSSAGMNAQDINDHRWENRLVLILTDKQDTESYLNQVKEFKSHLEGLNERKIIVYHITPGSFKSGLADEKWHKAETVYDLYKKTASQPEIILIGLDGGIKLREEKFLSAQKLFATVDVMPMRQQEIERRKR